MAGWIVVGGLAVLALAAVLPVRAQFRHGRHERPPPRTDPGELEDAWARGSMDLRADLALHHELPGWPVDPVPWEALASDERIEQPPPSEAEVEASRAAHGYIPELDPGPEAVADTAVPGPDQDGGGGVPGSGHEPAQLTLPPRPATDLGPRACAVLARYEALRAERWALG